MFLVNKDSEQDFHNVTSEESYNPSKKISPLIIETSNSETFATPGSEISSRHPSNSFNIRNILVHWRFEIHPLLFTYFLIDVLGSVSRERNLRSTGIKSGHEGWPNLGRGGNPAVASRFIVFIYNWDTFCRTGRLIPRTILVWTSAGAFDGSLELRPR